MPRLRLATRAGLVLAVALPLSLALLSCTGGGGDPASPSQPAITGDTYVRATVTLLDSGSPCIPGLACAPEFVSCDGRTEWAVPATWTVHASRATAGAVNYSPTAPPATDGFGTLVITGTDVAGNTALSVSMTLTVNATTGAVTSTIGGNPAFTFVNVEASCAEINSAYVPLTQFGLVTGEPSPVNVNAPVSNLDLVFAEGPAIEVSGGLYEGTFSFVGQNREVVGVNVYTGRVRVDGCFRVQVPFDDQAVPVDPVPASPACP